MRAHAELLARRRRRAASRRGSAGANRKPMPTSRRQRVDHAPASASTSTPSASSTSAEPRARRLRAVAVLGDAHARRRDDERRERRDVERAASRRRRCRRCRRPRRPRHAQRASRARASRAPRRRPRRRSRPSCAARPASAPICAGVASPSMICADDRRPSRRRQVAAVDDARDASRRSSPDRAHGSHRLGASRRGRPVARGSCAAAALPAVVRIDSGWNCTPSTRQRLVAHAHDLVLRGPRRDLERSRAATRALDHSEW